MRFLPAKYAGNAFAAGAPPQIPLHSVAGFKGPTSKRRGWQMREREQGRAEREKREGRGILVLIFTYFEP